MYSKMLMIVLAAAGIAGVFYAGLARAAVLEADYQLQDTYNSSVGSIGPLTTVGSAADVSFEDNQTVDGNTQSVLHLSVNYASSDDMGAGVQAQTAGFLSSTAYSVVLLADFNLDADLVATKVLDFKNLSSDDGLYINDATGLLYFNGAIGATGGTPAVTGTYTQIVLTRDDTGLLTVYEGTTEAFQFNDSSDLAVLGDSVSPSSNAYLTAFKDDATGVGSTLVDETSVGDIARLRLYDGALTADEVAALSTTIPEPISSGMLAMGGLFLLRRARPK